MERRDSEGGEVAAEAMEEEARSLPEVGEEEGAWGEEEEGSGSQEDEMLRQYFVRGGATGSPRLGGGQCGGRVADSQVWPDQAQTGQA